MTLYFLTGNPNKAREAKEILPEIEQLHTDLPEIQDSDPKKIIKAKLEEALKHKQGDFIVDDTSLSFECLNGLPGPLIKWFLKSIGAEGLFQLTQKLGNQKAEARAIIGYATNGDIYFFEGSVKGTIVSPRGQTGFGWDSIFQPEGQSQTYAEMTQEEKNAISHRRKALNKLSSFLGKP